MVLAGILQIEILDDVYRSGPDKRWTPLHEQEDFPCERAHLGRRGIEAEHRQQMTCFDKRRYSPLTIHGPEAAPVLAACLRVVVVDPDGTVTLRPKVVGIVEIARRNDQVGR